MIAARIGQSGGAAPRRKGIGLNLAQRDRRLGERAVGMEHRVPRVLPPLLNQSRLTAARVLDEAVAVDVAGTIEPLERRENVRPESFDERQVCRAIEVGGREGDEE